MKTLLFIFVFMMPFGPLLADETLPPDVQRFVDRREGCDHTRGEAPEPGDRQAMKDIARQMKTLCTGTDKALARLKKKYASNPSAMRRLNEFETTIEETKHRR